MRTFLIGNAFGAVITLGAHMYAPLNVIYAGGALIIGFLAAGYAWRARRQERAQR